MSEKSFIYLKDIQNAIRSIDNFIEDMDFGKYKKEKIIVNPLK